MPLIEIAGPADAEAIAALHAASWRATYRGILRDDFLDGGADQALLKLWGERLRDPATVSTRWVAKIERASHLEAFACLFLDVDLEWGAVLDNLHVAPERHGHGFGRALIAAAAEWVIRQRPDSPLHLWVYEKNVRAIAFYERLGGRLAGRKLGTALNGERVDGVRFAWTRPAALVRAARGGSKREAAS